MCANKVLVITGRFLCSSRLVKLAESYRPERQPKAYNMKDLGPVFQHISAVVELKAARLLDEDRELSQVQDEFLSS